MPTNHAHGREGCYPFTADDREAVSAADAGCSGEPGSSLPRRREAVDQQRCSCEASKRESNDTAVTSEVAFDQERELIRQKVQERGVNGSAGLPFALAFSGGGTRAAAFQAGMLWRLAEAGCLRNVEHFIAVSGGCFLSSAFASQLVAAGRPNTDEDIDDWYRRLVARTICRMQANAGYWVRDSWVRPFSIKKDGSGLLPPIFDLPMNAAVLLYTVLLNPLTHLVVFLVPIAECVNFFMGTAMRAAYCAPTESQAWEIFENWGPLHVWLKNLIKMVVLLFLIWMLGKLPPCRKPRAGSRKEAQWEEREGKPLRKSHRQAFQYVLSLRAALTRIVAISGITILVLCISMSTQLGDMDYTDTRLSFCREFVRNDGAHPSVPKQGESNDCGSMRMNGDGQWEPWWHDQAFNIYRGYSDVPGSNATSTIQLQGSTLMRIFAWPLKERILKGSSLFVTVVIFLVAILAGALVLSPLFKGLFITCLSFLGPAVGLLLVASFVQYRVFGPLTGQYYSEPFRLWPFDNEMYLRFHLGSLVLAFFLLIFYHSTHFAMHYYFMRTLRMAYFAKGQDFTWNDLRRNPFCPLLINTMTVSDWKRPGDKEGLTEISITPLHTGSAKTGFVETPPWRSIAKCTALAAAALDAVFLSLSDNRFWNEFLNLRLGDYILFERFRSNFVTWCKSRMPTRRRESFFLYEFPLVAICGSTYIVFIAAGFLAQSSEKQTCDSAYRLYVVSLHIIIVVFFCSFFGWVPLLEFFVHSPLIRQLHTLMRYIHVSETPPSMVFVSDGGAQDCTGLLQLMRRRCDRILLALAGADPEDDLFVLRATMREAMAQKFGFFYDPVDPRRDVFAVLDEFGQDKSQTFIHLGIRYTVDAPGLGRGDARSGRLGGVLEGPCAGSGCDGKDDASRPAASRGGETAHLLIVKNRLPPDWQGRTCQPLLTEDEVAAKPDSGKFDPAAEARIMRGRCHGLREERAMTVDDLGGCCCNCCHSVGYCNWGQTFPHPGNANQCLSPLYWSSLCRLGYELSEEAVRAMITSKSFAEEWEDFVKP